MIEGDAGDAGFGEILLQLLLGFGTISLVAVGGGIAVLPEMHRLVVEVHAWMSGAAFSQLFALAQAAPGPNVLVVGLIGWHVAGFPGMLVATIAMCGPSSLLAYGFARLRARVAGRQAIRTVERGLVPIAVGLIAASGLLLAQGAARGVLSFVITAGSALFVWGTNRSPLWVLAAGAVAGAAFL